MKLKRLEQKPVVEEIGRDLYRIQIPQPFYTDNNVYLINSGEPTLIDSGYVENLGMLQYGLKQLGLSLGSIQHIFYTHEHVDHISAAIVLRFYTRQIKLYGMRGMARSVGHYGQFIQVFQRAMDRLIYKAHRDTEERRFHLEKSRRSWGQFLASLHTTHKVDPILRMDINLVEGDVIQVGEREIGFLHTPGHNRWHLTPYILGEGIYFTGDLILQNISSIYAEEDGNLSDYHQSLARLSQLPIKRLLPAHGPEPESPQRAIKMLSRTLSLLERGIVRRLKEKDHDLKELVTLAIGARASDGNHYATAIATIHSIVDKHIKEGSVEVLEIDPPYERYRWKQ